MILVKKKTTKIDFSDAIALLIACRRKKGIDIEIAEPLRFQANFRWFRKSYQV